MVAVWGMLSPDSRFAGDVSSRPLIATLLAIGLLIPTIGVAFDIALRTGVTDSGLIDGLRNLFFPDAEGNVFSWYSTIVLASVAVGFFLIALATMGAGRSAWPFTVLGAIALLLSVDEAAYLHERLSIFARELGLSSSFTYQWLLVGIPIAVVIGLFVLWLSRHLDRTLRLRLIVAGAVFLAGSVGGEILGGVLAKVDLGIVGDTKLFAHDAEVLIEEGLEIVGAILAFRAVLLHLHVSNGPEGLAFSLAPAERRLSRRGRAEAAERPD